MQLSPHGGSTRASYGMNQKSYPMPTVAGTIVGNIIAFISLVTASHLVTVAVHVIIMIDISIATVANDSLL